MNAVKDVVRDAGTDVATEQVMQGIWVPIVTPFQHGQIDKDALAGLARKLVADGVAGIVACGTTGEAAALTDAEQLMVLDTVLAAVPDCPVMMGLAGNNLAHMLEMQKKIAQRPVVGLLIPPPYYIRPSQAALITYYRTLADASNLPLVIYNIPYRTGVALELETFRTLAQHTRIVAVKDCGANDMLTMQLIADGQLHIFAGEDKHLLSSLCLGAKGVIAATAHIRPDLYVKLHRLVQAGEITQARRIFYQLLPMINCLFSEPNPAPVKAALAMMNVMTDELRAPMQVATPELKVQIREIITRLEC